MISYCSTEKSLCEKIFEYLHTHGYRVWFDETNMHGNTISTMANAIENSQTIIICMSDNYQKSNACRHEVDFAYVKQRRIIPLVVQSNFQPQEWLAFIIGSSPHIDFVQHEFDRAYEMLENEIKIISNQSENIHENKRVDQWTSNDVYNWCQSNNLSTFVPLLEHYDGPSLVRLHKMSQNRSDEEMFKLLQNDYEQIQQKTSMKFTFMEFVRFQTILNQRLTHDLSPASNTRFCSIF